MKHLFQLGDLVRVRATGELGIVVKTYPDYLLGDTFDLKCLGTARQDPILQFCLAQYFELVSRAEQ
jgi:hypothetical protein